MNNPLFLLCVFLAIFSLSCSENKESKTALTIIHINDVHGRTQAEPYISQMAKSMKAENKNFLILDAGDRLHGQIAANLSKGETMAEVMNSVGYNAMVPGNHDFNFGAERLKELSETMNFPLLAANVKDANGKNLFKQYEIFKKGEMNFCVFGIATPETKFKADPRIVAELSFENPAESAALVVKKLKDENCNVIIALAHLGDNSLVSVPGIDVIIDGHSHALLENGENINDILIVQTGEHSKNIGIIEINFSGKKTETKTAKVIAAETANIAPDSAIIAVLAEQEKKVKSIASEVIGKTSVDLIGENQKVRTGETNFGILCAEAIRAATKADIGLINGGNIRAGIKSGNITKGDIISALPFDNIIVTKSATGAQLKKILEHSVSKLPEADGRYLQMSGIKIEVNPSNAIGQRITSVKTDNGQTLDEKKKYTIAVNDFIANGGDDFPILKDLPVITIFNQQNEIIIDYIIAAEKVSGALPIRPEGS